MATNGTSIGGIDTQGLYEQYQASLDAFLGLVETAIDGTTAGNLQSQIDVLTDNVDILTGNVDISDETIAAFEALGWTPPVGGAVIESLFDWISNHAEFYKEKGSNQIQSRPCRGGNRIKRIFK